MVPDSRQLRYFVAVAEELHFSRAAKRLNMAQPPLSQQIRQLERTLGVQLFVRSTRRVQLTPAGAVFLDGARRVLAEMERAAETTRRASRGEFDTLRIGFTDAAALSVLPAAVRHFGAAFPGVHLDLREGDGTASQLEALQRDLVDVALVRGPLEQSGLRLEVLLEDRFCVALHGAHPLAGLSRVPLRRLRGEPMVWFPRRLSPTYYDLLMGMCLRAGFTPEQRYEVVRHQTALSLVAAGVGISLVPSSVSSLAFPEVTYRELSGAPERAQVGALYRPHRPSVPLEGLLGVLRHAAREKPRR